MTNSIPNPLPRDSLARYGCYVALIAGVVMLGFGAVLLLGSDKPAPLAVALFLAGSLEALLSMYALSRHRAAWAFLTALNGTLGVIFFFGATKIRDEMGIHLVLALFPSLALLVATVLLALSAQDYES